jgi:hypothetical protein
VNNALNPIRPAVVRENLADQARDRVTSVRQLQRHATFKVTEPLELVMSPVSWQL